MKTEDFVRGGPVAFDDLRVGEWYLNKRNRLFCYVGRSQFKDEAAIDCVGTGLWFLSRGDLVFEAVPKPKVEYRRNTIDFYFYDKRLEVSARSLKRLLSVAPLEPVATAVIEVGSDGSVRIVREGA